MIHVALSSAKPRTGYHGSNLLSCRATLTVVENPTMEMCMCVLGGGGRNSKVSSVIYAVVLSWSGESQEKSLPINGDVCFKDLVF